MSEPRVTANSIAWLIACAVLLAAGLPVAAAEDSADDKWTFRGEAYLWAPAIKGHTSAADPIDIQFSDIFQNLGIAAMGKLAARKDKVTLFTDLIYYGDVGTGQSDLTWQALGHSATSSRSSKACWATAISGGTSMRARPLERTLIISTSPARMRGSSSIFKHPCFDQEQYLQNSSPYPFGKPVVISGQVL